MTKNTDTTIRFSGLKSGLYTYNFTLDDSFFSEWKNEKILGGEVLFDVRMEKTERMMIFFFSLQGKVRTTCDRCLGEMEWPVEGEERLCVKFSDTEQSDDEDVLFVPENESEIDLGQLMYEYVAVRMPIQCMHDEGDCDQEMLKLMDQHEEHQTQDPRWEALKQLRENGGD